MLFSIILIGLLGFAPIPTPVSGKECTNVPTHLSPHAPRSQLLSSVGHRHTTNNGHLHLNHAEDTTWTNLLPLQRTNVLPEEKENRELDWAMLYRKIKKAGINSPGTGRRFLKEFSLHDVRLDPTTSAHGRAQQTNLEYLLLLDVDSLVWSFRKQAGLNTPGTPYGGWEAPHVELRGHFVGHYMSATAKMWASTHNSTLKSKMNHVVHALDSCQKKIDSGYLSAFPTEFFDRFEAIQPVWAPYYTIHKIMAGLLDQYLYAKNEQALKMVIWMAQYFENRVRNVIFKYTIERHWTSLNEETGGMNDVLYDLYTVTRNPKHLVLAHLFDKPCFLGLLALQADSLSGFHVNTHIPIVIGAQKRYEITGDPLYKVIGTYFMDVVNSSHSYATGGTSVNEFWYDPKHLVETLTTETEESCTTYNMLKVSRNLFKWTKEMAYVDYYERALTNGVLSIQRGTEPGKMIYMLPLRRGASKAATFHGWGKPFDSFWCCYGTGIESFSKLGDSIYFEEENEDNSLRLYIVQFVSSSLTWKSLGIVVKQQVHPVQSYNPFLHVKITFSSLPGLSSTNTTNTTNTTPSYLNIRIPFWTKSNGAEATLNGKNLPIPNPGEFLVISNKWSAEDQLLLKLPLELRIEKLKDKRTEYKSIQAILFGPYLLAGLSKGDWELNIGSAKSLSDWIEPIRRDFSAQLASFAQPSEKNKEEILILTNSNNTLKMDTPFQNGIDAAIHATFRLIQSANSNTKSNRSEYVIEPFDLPGATVVHQGRGKELTISTTGASDDSSLFSFVVMRENSSMNVVALESVSKPGCFICSYADKKVKLDCGKAMEKSKFFIYQGAREYNSISFVAKGGQRNFVLEPLMSLRDESYTVYFNISTTTTTA